jgi:putative heme iron utilization protein
LQYLPEPDFLEFQLPQGYIAVITDDGTSTTTKVVESLTELGWKAVVLNFPASLVPNKSPLPEGIQRLTLLEMSEEHLQKQLTAIATDYGQVGAFIHIHPLFKGDNNQEILFSSKEKAVVKHVFLMAKHLKKSLNEATNHGRSCFCTVTRLDGAFGLEHKVNFGAIGAGLFGLTKTLVWEWSRVFCRAIDLNPEIECEQSANLIIAELHDSNRYLTEVAYGSYGRVTLTTVLDKG